MSKRRKPRRTYGHCSKCGVRCDTTSSRIGIHAEGQTPIGLTVEKMDLVFCDGVGKRSKEWHEAKAADAVRRAEEATEWQREAAVGALDMHISNRDGSRRDVFPNRMLFWRAAFRWYTRHHPTAKPRHVSSSTVWSRKQRDGKPMHIIHCLFCGEVITTIAMNVWSTTLSDDIERWNATYDHTFECALRFLAGEAKLAKRTPRKDRAAKIEPVRDPTDNGPLFGGRL